MKSTLVTLLILALLGLSAPAEGKGTKIRGTVEDAATRQPVRGATVSASGDTAKKSEITDDSGFFSIVIEGVSPGDLVRIRVVAPGYGVYDRQIVTSEEIPVAIQLHQIAAAAPPRLDKPVASNDPVTQRYIRLLKRDSDWGVRLHALEIVGQNAKKGDTGAVSAVCAAVLDEDYRVRDLAVKYIAWLQPASGDAITSLLIAVNDISDHVRAEAVIALGYFPKSKKAVETLFRIMGVPPTIDTRAMVVLYNMDIDDPRLLAALVHAATKDEDKNATVALKQLGKKKKVVNALFVALGEAPNVNAPAMNMLIDMGLDDPRLVAALVYLATEKNDDAAVASLGKFPRDPAAVATLFSLLGPKINDVAVKTLDATGSNDPRLLDALLTRAGAAYDTDAKTMILKRAPFSPELVARIMTALTTALDSPRNYLAQIYVSILLAGGDSGRQALHQYLSTADVPHQSALTLAWLEVDHRAKNELLANIRVADVQADLVKSRKLVAVGPVSLPESPTMDEPCNRGHSLRATMGLAILEIAPREHATRSLIQDLDARVDSCVAYAAIVLGWLGPGIGREGLTRLVHTATCKSGAVSQVAATKTLALIGTEESAMQLVAGRDEWYCSPDPDFSNGDNGKDLARRIRARLAAH